MAITGKQPYILAVDEWQDIATYWRDWDVERKKKGGPWVLTHRETGRTVTSHDRRKAEKKMREFHRAHRRMVESWP